MFKSTKRTVYRWLGAHGVFNNSLSPVINLRYQKYAEQCRKQAKLSCGQFSDAPDPITEPQHIRQIIPASMACELSQRISKRIAAQQSLMVESDNPVFIGIKNPLSLLGDAVIDIFDSPELDDRIRRHFGGFYKIAWLDCYRTVPSDVRKQAWLWHSDNVPAGLLKVQVLLTDASRNTGAIEILPRSQTLAFRKAGYFGDIVSERLAELSDFAKQHNIDFSPNCVEAKAGDVLLFDNNHLHRANPPKQDFRDALTILLFPSAIPWREAYQLSGKAAVEHKPGGYPLYPQNLHQ